MAGPSRPARPLLLPYRPSIPTATPNSLQRVCPTCSQPLTRGLPTGLENTAKVDTPVGARGRGYFQILEEAHEGSRPPSPTPSRRDRSRTRTPTPYTAAGPGTDEDEDEDEDTMDERDLPAKGYYERYFREERRLGMGAEGSVYLATHIIGGSVLGESFNQFHRLIY